MEEEKDLIKKAQEGDKEAFGEIYKRYLQKIYRYCRFNTKNEELAKDICQDCFVKAWKRIKSFKTEGQWSIQSFLFTIARNLIIDSTRKKKELSLETIEMTTQFESNEDLYEESDKKRTVEQMQNVLSKLEEVDKQIILLRYFEEIPSSEVAKILGIKDGALRVRTFRVMQKMKDIFETLYGRQN